MAAGSLFMSGVVQAQPVQTINFQKLSLEQAVKKAMDNYPAIKAAQLEIESQQALRKTAWEIGDTKVFIGKEEVGNGADGITTKFGVSQEFDLLGIPSRLKLQKENEQLAEQTAELTYVQVELMVKQNWADVFSAKQKFDVLDKLFAQFTDISRAAELRLETEATSRLEYLSTLNQANKIKIQKEQAFRDYLSAVRKLNKWFEGDSLYTVKNVSVEELDERINFDKDALNNHPYLTMMEQKVDVAEAVVKKDQSRFLPKFSASYGFQEIANQSGFYKYELGVRFPLLFWGNLGKTQSSKIQTNIARQNLNQAQKELNSMYNSMQENYLKWLNSWEYYKEEALPLAEEQRKGALTAYKEGAIDYVMFLQNIRDAIQIEVESWDAFSNYLNSRYELEYYLNTPNK